MPLHTPTSNPADPRMLAEHAYLSCGPNLYYVLRAPKEGIDQVLLEDCRTLKASSSSRQQVLSDCKLVRAAQ